MRVAVTGATGFIGGHVTAALEQLGASVIVLSRTSSSINSDLACDEVISCEIGSEKLPSLSDIGDPDCLIHLAWGGLPNYLSTHHFEEELPKHYRFLGHLIRSGLKNLLVTGTCFEYGMRSGALREDMMPAPDNSYAFAKDALRQQLEFLKKDHPYNLVWSRLFYMYGEGQGEKSLYSQLKDAVDKGKPEFDMSQGEQLRDFLKVEEVGSLIARLALTGSDIGAVNVCSGSPISVRQLVEDWIAENGWEISLNRGVYPYPAYEPLAFWGDSGKIGELLRL